jgi:hypothetical protein
MQRWLPQKCSNIHMLPFMVEGCNSKGAYREMDVPAFLRIFGASISPDVNPDSRVAGME